MSGLEKWRMIDHITVKEYEKLKKWNLENGQNFQLDVRWKVVGKNFGLRFYCANNILFEEMAHYKDIVHVAIEAQFKLQELIKKYQNELDAELKNQELSYYQRIQQQKNSEK
jgi:hypothetical protein